jgi:4-hydroxy-tetrahydrodipicolinate synthase
MDYIIAFQVNHRSNIQQQNGNQNYILRISAIQTTTTIRELSNQGRQPTYPTNNGKQPLSTSMSAVAVDSEEGSSSTSTGTSTTNANIQYPMKRGTTVALVTPMDPITGSIKYDELRSILRYHVNAGTDNLCILGTTGEASVLSNDEIVQTLQIAVEEVKGKMTILAGTGTINPATVRANTIRAADLGCDAALIVTPYYVKPPQRGLIQHFTSMADIPGGLPVLMYNVPGRTGVNIDDTSIVTCSQHPNIIGLKDATGNLQRHANIQALLKQQQQQQQQSSSFLLYSGDDGTTVDYVAQGGDGCISVTCNVAAKLMHDVVHMALIPHDGVMNESYQTSLAEAYRLNKQYLDPLHDALFVEANPIPVKYAMSKIGLITSGYARPPLMIMDTQYESILNDALRTAKLL